ncbi:hypothetical protein L5G28_02380 [Gordonia sp. HY285]|uniref:hypothetical protein n=1 Tax=Gordonia liuliyuniae TaxID=2911517 RepID=UPI001F427164|nr:hypothetical protein [Gordonia liuliyuniae]MCF8609014.1 hypothetical protein [Gordonia liuliyuniae]
MLTGKADDDAVDRATDLDLAYAWLYEDSVHGDLPSYDEFSARERYSAATHVFGGIACVTLDTLEYLRRARHPRIPAVPGRSGRACPARRGVAR